ncbi:Mrl1p [Kluyveromyces lactis]|uniref:KLLA0B09020p n=1 Tax=Kluyveromyces lactis (strain ATCC 8585 / CBS 2359 / DSM 70799 / NBRC 1267 / NRRL Y-1140 / WM37) TaxID=284590 RepID=Q6CVV9_KLULA|nr:uncharacterized protein KLLA0_B09020g [Kluyveromyces lactis]CAH02323.1 KLLA0B09020p [Kluyveromyces lactis]|eukprot:XP_451930.1 uncharacterized protein KLLA0_B09020g [Kluyveromyces lactis]
MTISLRSYKLVIGLLLLLAFAGTLEVSVASSDNKAKDPVPHDGKGDNGRNDDDQEDPFCSVVNPNTGGFIDLSWLSSTPNEEKHDGNKDRNRKEQSKTRWLVKGWEYNTNFTLGICSSSVGSELKDQLKDTTGAYYVDHANSDKLVSIGDFSSTPKFTGKKLTMTYEGGDTCPNGVDKKSTLINFVCDKEIATKAQISFIGQLHNCSYFFEVRSIHACPISNIGNDINAVGIFASIIAVFLLIEIARRVVYELLVVEKRHNGDSGGTSEVPRWVNTEQEPLWRRILRSVPWSGLGRKKSNKNLVRLRTRENTGISIDMEQQNELLDSLDIEANSME